jgi:hypothetical protein
LKKLHRLHTAKKNLKLEDRFEKSRENGKLFEENEEKWSEKDIENIKKRLKDIEVTSAYNQDKITGIIFTFPPETIFKDKIQEI